MARDMMTGLDRIMMKRKAEAAARQVDLTEPIVGDDDDDDDDLENVKATIMRQTLENLENTDDESTTSTVVVEPKEEDSQQSSGDPDSDVNDDGDKQGENVEDDDQSFRVGDPFERMVADFKEFARNHQIISPLNLVFEEQRPGIVLIYQGQRNIVWAWLRNTGCTITRRSLLRSILNLEDGHYLKQYFAQYSMTTGEHDASL